MTSWQVPGEGNGGELSQRQAGAILGLVYLVRDMTKRYFGPTDNASPAAPTWNPGSGFRSSDMRSPPACLHVRPASDAARRLGSRVKTTLAHIRGDITDPTVARNAMDDKLSQPDNAALYRKRSVSIEPVFGNIKANL